MDYETFEEFEAVLIGLCNSDKYSKKSEAPLISPATYVPDTTRANDNVVSWGGFGILDVDDFVGEIDEIKKKYCYYIHKLYCHLSIMHFCKH